MPDLIAQAIGYKHTPPDDNSFSHEAFSYYVGQLIVPPFDKATGVMNKLHRCFNRLPIVGDIFTCDMVGFAKPFVMRIVYVERQDADMVARFGEPRFRVYCMSVDEKELSWHKELMKKIPNLEGEPNSIG